jgi:hypothetical protein
MKGNSRSKASVKFCLRAAVCGLSLALSCSAWAELSPVQTTQAWISTVKRNDVNAIMLLAFTPEENLQHRKSSRDGCDVFKRWYDDLGGNTAAVNAKLAEYATPHLGRFDNEANRLVLAIFEMFTNIPHDNETKQLDHMDLQRALQAWSDRTDFGDPRRLLKSISTTVEQWEHINRGMEHCARETDKAYFKRFDHALIALKSIARNYELDIDKILASASVRAGPQYTDDAGQKYAQVLIRYQVFEARVEMPLVLYQLDDQWFFEDVWKH